ncbi:MAG TPA: insulinase family protein, partial [Chitinophagaceae bacterium]|nr:insulinase family protein [Chitinophagaceae bacterium]
MKNFKHYILAGILLATTFQITAQGYKLPAYEKFKLPNGLVIYLMEQHEVPLISVSAIFPAGAIYDGEQSGLASLTAAGLKHGTQSMTKAQLDEELDFLGASVNTFASKESSGLSAKFSAKDKDKILSLIKEILLNPVFD